VTRRLPEGRAKTLAAKRRRIFPFQNLGSEFMPPLYEGDLLYMPTTFPGISPTKARELIQTTDKIIKSFPEVRSAFGKNRPPAETATDPAPFDMVETTIMLNDEKDWPVVDIKTRTAASPPIAAARPDDLVGRPECRHPDSRPQQRLDHAHQDAHLTCSPPASKRPSASRSPARGLPELERVASENRGGHQAGARPPPAPSPNAFMAGNYVEFEINRDEIARYGLRVATFRTCSVLHGLTRPSQV